MMRGMERSIQKMRGHVFLEPYTSSLHVSCHYTSTKPNVDPKKLPQLPVPNLSDTLQKYLKTVRPHLNDEEFAVTSSLVKDFEKGDGQKLQTLLKKRADKTHNWLEEWWLKTAYLGYRDPVVVFSSPGLVFPFRKFPSQEDQLRYAAKTLLAALEYKGLIDNDNIPLEKMGKNPLDMSQYKKIFGTCRIPHEKNDKLSYNDNSRHVTIIHNNHVFHLDLWGDDNNMLSENQLIEQLKYIVKSSQTPTNDAIGILTSDNRDNWAIAYQILCKGIVSNQFTSISIKTLSRSWIYLEYLDQAFTHVKCESILFIKQMEQSKAMSR